MTRACTTQVLHSGDLICEGIIKQQAEPAKAEDSKKEEAAAQEPSQAAAPAQPVPAAGVTASVAVISVSHPRLQCVWSGGTRLARHLLIRRRCSNADNFHPEIAMPQVVLGVLHSGNQIDASQSPKA